MGNRNGWMRNLGLFISEGPELVRLLFEQQNQRAPCRGSGLLCCFLPCQEHLVGFGTLLNPVSAVSIGGQGVLLPRDVQEAWETPCPLTKGVLRCWDQGTSKPQPCVACGCAVDRWKVPLLCFEPVSCTRRLCCWRVWGVENLHWHMLLYL